MRAELFLLPHENSSVLIVLWYKVWPNLRPFFGAIGGQNLTAAASPRTVAHHNRVGITNKSNTEEKVNMHRWCYRVCPCSCYFPTYPPNCRQGVAQPPVPHEGQEVLAASSRALFISLVK